MGFFLLISRLPVCFRGGGSPFKSSLLQGKEFVPTGANSFPFRVKKVELSSHENVPFTFVVFAAM